MDPELTWRDYDDGCASSVSLGTLGIGVHRRGRPKFIDQRASVYLDAADEYPVEAWRFEDDPSLAELKARAEKAVAAWLRDLADRVDGGSD